MGISGRRKPEEKKSGGLSVVWLAVPVVLAVGALYYVPELLAKGLSRATKLDTPPESSARALPVRAAPLERSLPVPAPTVSAVHPAPSPAPLWVAGIVRLGDRVNVVLSDGRVLTERDRELEIVERNSVVVEGRKVFFARPAVRVVDARPLPVAAELPAELPASAPVSPPVVTPAVPVRSDSTFRPLPPTVRKVGGGVMRSEPRVLR